MAIELAFWLDKPRTLLEFKTGLYPLLELRYYKLAAKSGDKLSLFSYTAPLAKAIQVAIEQKAPHPLIIALIERGIDEDQVKAIEPLFSHFEGLDTYRIWTYLLQNKFAKAAKLFKKIPTESDPLFYLYGCLQTARKGEEKGVHFLTDIMVSRYPPIHLLLSHYLLGRIDLKKNELFFWEKLQLYRQLKLFYHCAKKRKLKAFFSKKIQRLRANRRCDILL